MPEDNRKDNKKPAIIIGASLALLGAGLAIFSQIKKKIPPENIVLSDLVIEPAEVYVGEPVSISVIATNTGGVAGSYEITCEVA